MGDSTMDMRLAEFSPSCGLWPDILLDEIFQAHRSCSERGSQAGSGLGAPALGEGLRNCTLQPQEGQGQPQRARQQPGAKGDRDRDEARPPQCSKWWDQVRWGEVRWGQERGWGPRWEQPWALQLRVAPEPWHGTHWEQRGSDWRQGDKETKRQVNSSLGGQSNSETDFPRASPCPVQLSKVRLNSWTSWYNHTDDPVCKWRYLPVRFLMRSCTSVKFKWLFNFIFVVIFQTWVQKCVSVAFYLHHSTNWEFNIDLLVLYNFYR